MSPAIETTPYPRIAILGAGIAGPLLSTALAAHSIPSKIYERDPSPNTRGAGWGLTIHWALAALESLLPKALFARLPEVFVDPSITKTGDEGNFLFIELKSGEVRYKVPPNRRIRIRREGLRSLLLEKSNVEWGRKVQEVNEGSGGALVVQFEDGDAVEADLVIGCDGISSKARESVVGKQNSTNWKLPVKLMGVSVEMSREKAEKMRKLDPLFLQAAEDGKDVFFWFSFLNTPENSPSKTDTYTCQILISWPYRAGFNGSADPTEVPETNAKRLALMKDLASSWTDPFRTIVNDIPEGTEVQTIRLEDWVPTTKSWNNKGGRMTLVGDAAHAMVMFRGEGANHSIEDVSSLLSHLLPLLEQAQKSGKKADFSPAVTAYEAEMVERTQNAVLASRQACLDAHVYEKINDKSPLIARRVKMVKELGSEGVIKWENGAAAT